MSFEIENLFPFIFSNKVIDMVAELLLNKFGTISKNKIKQLLKFSTENVLFQFGAVFYKQRNEVLMASPLAFIIAEIYLFNFENKNIFIDILTKECFYYRYVHYIFMIISADIKTKFLKQNF